MSHPCHLVAHSCYSFQRGVATPREMASAATRMGYTALAITDLRGLYGAVEFQKAAREAGIQPLFGAGFPLENAGATRLTAIASNGQGYANLCRLITRDQLARPKNAAPEARNAPRKDLAAWAPELAEGVIFLTNDADLARGLHPSMARGSLYLELYQSDTPNSRREIRSLLALGRELGRPAVASARPCFICPEDYAVHALLSAIRLGKTIHTLDQGDTMGPDAFLASPREMERRFREIPEAWRRTAEVAEQCDFTLPADANHYPRYATGTEETPEACLTRLCHEAVPRFYSPPQQPAAFARLQKELDVILTMGYASYFLVVWDIVQYARREGIPSTGRGSAADSLVAYLLDMTHVDPIRHDLYFERFLNPERTTHPDIDIDLCWRRRDAVLDYVYQRYGAEQTAMISTHVCFAGRSCVREVGKAMGIAEGEITRYTRFLPHFGPLDVEKIQSERPESRNLDFQAEPMRSILPMAQRIQGLPSHLGLHASGIVVAPSPLMQWCPLEKATKGLVVTQYDMYPIEDLGLMKIDLLGQRSLSVIADACKQIRREDQPGFRFTMTNCQPQASQTNGTAPVQPEDDKATQDLIQQGRTMGVFQIESPAMRGILQKVRARDFSTVTAASSVIRPGPKDSGMLHAWIRRHKGLEAPKFLHPALRDVLAETHGVLMYQEDVLKVARVIANFSLGKADLMRRSMSGKRVPIPLAQMEADFLDGAAANGISPAAARHIWDQMRAFAGYAFCKAHSASYTVLSFQSAWLKAHYPAIFMAAVLANGGGYYDRAAYVSEARRMGLRILPPCLHTSGAAWHGRGEAIRCGLRQIRHLREETIAHILQERQEKGLFRSFPEALERLVHVAPAEWDALIRVGAADCLLDGIRFRNRPQLLWWLDRHHGSKDTARQLDLFGKAETSEALPDLPSFSWERKFDEEAERLDLWIRAHPLTRFRRLLPEDTRRFISPPGKERPAGQPPPPDAPPGTCIPACEMPRHAGRHRRLVGWLVTSRRLAGARGGAMKFLCLEDETAIYEAVLFHKAYQQFGAQTLTRGPYLLEGRIEQDEGHCTLRVSSLTLIR